MPGGMDFARPSSSAVACATTRIMSRSLPRQRLMSGFGAAVPGVNMIFMIFTGMYPN